MNPFPIRQAAENYLAKIPDLAQREATRIRLGLTTSAKHVDCSDYSCPEDVEERQSFGFPPGLPRRQQKERHDHNAKGDSCAATRPSTGYIQIENHHQEQHAAHYTAAPPPGPLHGVVVPPNLTFTLPFPPSLNSIWRAMVITKGGKPMARILLSQEGRAYRLVVRNVIRSLGNPTTPPGARLALTLTACPQIGVAVTSATCPKP
ncbi:hypothetical protein [Deinococcus hohokamensis]|uniref:Uncharacterized protein n=1 Tax=Deinococcus hohokamensis TaxID=309883 RepID=A0ABV9I8A9_9DEIO